jgi:protein gp37
MGEATAISWCKHTFNVWWGCEHGEREPGSSEPAPECVNCYAEIFDRRLGGEHWGSGATPRFFGSKYWAKPVVWNAAAEKAGERARVFCASMADWAQLHRDQVVRDRQRAELHRLWQLINATPWLDWMLLTKRIDRAAELLPWGVDEKPWTNIWLGTTCGARSSLWRIDELRRVPAAVRFVSCEPLIDEITGDEWDRALGPTTDGARPIDLLIVGDESAAPSKRRPAHLDWVRIARDAAIRNGVALHLKQLHVDGKKVHLPILDGRRWAQTAGDVP